MSILNSLARAPNRAVVFSENWRNAAGEPPSTMTPGPEPHPHNGRFMEITRPRRIVFTWSSEAAGKDTLVTLDFARAGERSLLTLTHERLPQDKLEAHWSGWTSILEKLGQKAGAPA